MFTEGIDQERNRIIFYSLLYNLPYFCNRRSRPLLVSRYHAHVKTLRQRLHMAEPGVVDG